MKIGDFAHIVNHEQFTPSSPYTVLQTRQISGVEYALLVRVTRKDWLRQPEVVMFIPTIFLEAISFRTTWLTPSLRRTPWAQSWIVRES